MALLSSFLLALSLVATRRAVHKTGESFSPVPISAFLAVAMFGPAILIMGNTDGLKSLTWVGLGALAGAGVFHFVLGRMSAYVSVRLIGANLSSPIVNSNTLIATFLGIFFLGEPLTVYIILALILVVGGVFLVGAGGKPAPSKGQTNKAALTRGIMVALMGALCWGISPILVRIGVKEVGSPLQATFVSFVAASVVMAFALLNKGNSMKIRLLDRTSFWLIMVGAFLTSVAQFSKYVALQNSPVSFVSPLMATQSLMVLALSFFFNRKIEVFNIKIIMGAIAVVAGVSLIFLNA